jgi:prepilin-type N-terminal cleavage/methylation domain-containing protein
MKKVQLQKGFTLVEMIVSLGIFTIVALVAVGALIKVMDANKKSIALKTAINNMNFTLESMSREMRVGSDYIEEYNDSTGWLISFKSSKPYPPAPADRECNLRYAYKYTTGSPGGSLQKSQQIDCDNSNDYLNDFYDLISPEVKITSSIVEVNNDYQPYVSFFFKGYSGARAREQAEFTVQTLISQRLPK